MSANRPKTDRRREQWSDVAYIALCIGTTLAGIVAMGTSSDDPAAQHYTSPPDQTERVAHG